jgi:hypothetical protein
MAGVLDRTATPQSGWLASHLRTPYKDTYIHTYMQTITTVKKATTPHDTYTLIHTYIHTYIQSQQLKKLFDYFLPPLLRLIKKECREPIATKDTELVYSLIKLMNSHLSEFKDEDLSKAIPGGDIVKRIDGGFIYSLIWSVGCTTDDHGRTKFNDRLREMIAAEACPKISVPIPDRATVYDFCWDVTKCKWFGWLETIPQFQIAASAKPQVRIHSCMHVCMH